MNPYAPLFSHPVDLIFTTAVIAAWMGAGAFQFRRRFAGVPRSSEQYCRSFVVAFLWLCGAIAAVFLIGLIFLQLLEIKSGFWLIWQLVYLLSVTALFWVLPFFALATALWGYIGRYAVGYTWWTLALCNVCLFGLLLDVALYFAFTANFT